MRPGLNDFQGLGGGVDALIADFRAGRMPNATLLAGIPGVGKKTLAALLAQTALCTGGGAKPCGECPDCKRFLHGAHPDALLLEPEKDKVNIGIGPVRAVIDVMARHPFLGGRRAVVCPQADKLTAQAQNCLLKTLEEADEKTLFLLAADDVSKLLPTVISRCRVVRMQPWPQARVAAMLAAQGAPQDRAAPAAALCGGSLGLALDMIRSPEYFALREKALREVLGVRGPADVPRAMKALEGEKETLGQLLDIAEQAVRQALLVRMGMQDAGTLAGYPPFWLEAAATAPTALFERVLEAIFTARRMRANQVNWQLALERLLLHIAEECTSWQK